MGHLTCEIMIKRASEVIKIIQSPTINHAKPRNAIRRLKAVKKKNIILESWYNKCFVGCTVGNIKCQPVIVVRKRDEFMVPLIPQVGSVCCASQNMVCDQPKSKASWEAVVGMCSFRHYSVPFWHGAKVKGLTDAGIDFSMSQFVSPPRLNPVCLNVPTVWENPKLPQT